VPITPIELKKEVDAFVFHMPVDFVPVFCNKLGVRIECVSNLDPIVVEKLLQSILLFQEPGEGDF
jgi:hypothetical protein